MIRTIFRFWLVKLMTLVAVASGAGLFVGLWFHARINEEFLLRFEEPEMDLRASPAIEGEPIEVVAKLHNFGKVPLRITHMPMS